MSSTDERTVAFQIQSESWKSRESLSKWVRTKQRSAGDEIGFIFWLWRNNNILQINKRQLPEGLTLSCSIVSLSYFVISSEKKLKRIVVDSNCERRSHENHLQMLYVSSTCQSLCCQSGSVLSVCSCSDITTTIPRHFMSRLSLRSRVTANQKR